MIDHLTREIAFLLLRWAISALGTYLAAKGMMVTGDEMDIAAGILTSTFPLVPGIYRQVRLRVLAHRVAVESAVESVAQKRPVVVELTPVGQPNTATVVTPAEAAQTTQPVMVDANVH